MHVSSWSLAIAALAMLPPAVADAQRLADTYPSRPLRFIVPFAPGGGNDIIARTVGQKLAESFGQQVVVDNRAGAGGNIAGETAARAAPDGYTLFMLNSANLIAPSLYRKLGYDPMKDFAPISLLASSAFLIVVHPEVAARSIGELVALARAKPGTLTFASGGNGSATHLAAEQLALAAGLKLVHVPYKGASPAFIDLLAGQVAMYFSSLPPAIPHVKSGKVRAIAITSVQRARSLGDIPTVAEAGIPNFEAVVTYGVVTVAKTHPDIVRKLGAEFMRILGLPDTRARLEGQGVDIVASSPEEYAREIQREAARWAQVVAASRARAD